MTESIKLNDDQLKRTLSFKKKKTIKNILSQPESKIRLFTFAENETQEIERLLTSYLEPARLNNRPFVWSKLKALNKSERKEEKKKLSAQLNQNNNIEQRSKLFLGINAVSRGVKKSNLAAVLVADDIKPEQLIHHLLHLCLVQKVPYAVIHGLKKITTDALGFPSIALGFRKNEEIFETLIDRVRTLNKSYINEDLEEETDLEKSETINSKISQDCIDLDNSTLFPYLHRKSKKERIFIPSNDISESKHVKDFIKISEEVVPTNKSKLGISFKFRSEDENLKRKGSDCEVFATDIPEIVQRKKEWIIDTVGEKKKFKPSYHKVNILKFENNPDRVKKIKNKNIKKKKE